MKMKKTKKKPCTIIYFGYAIYGDIHPCVRTYGSSLITTICWSYKAAIFLHFSHMSLDLKWVNGLCLCWFSADVTALNTVVLFLILAQNSVLVNLRNLVQHQWRWLWLHRKQKTSQGGFEPTTYNQVDA